MWLIWLGVALIALKLLEISVFATLSWWWITVPFVLAFLWFEPVAALATTIGLLAAVLPARRAARLDPAQVIRYG